MRFLPFYFLILFCAQVFAAQNSEAYYLGEAFDFFSADGDVEAVTQLTNRILDKYPENGALNAQILEYSLRKKDRKLLLLNFSVLWKRNHCPPLTDPGSLKGQCQTLEHIWNENLKNVYFFEDTVVKLQRVKKLIHVLNCADSLAILKEVEAKEGSQEQILELYREAYICLKDSEAAKAVNLRIERLRILENES